MSQVKTEKSLLVLYAFIVILGITSCVTSAVAWTHWKSTLDHCIYRNCSCILFSEHTPNNFLGGPQAPCIFVTYAPIFYVLFSLCFVFFHGYRYLFLRKTPSARTVMKKNSDGETVQIAVQSDETDPLPKTFWVTLSVMNVVFVIFTLSHYITFLSGYLKTCKEYRKTLEDELTLGGSALHVIYNRLSCTAIFDFMDYIHPIPENSYRHGFIDTGLDLMIGLTSSFLTVLIFVMTSAFNIRRARINF